MSQKLLTFLVTLALVKVSAQFHIRTAVACEGHTLKIYCSGDDRIVIVDADYGRSDADTCPYFDDPNMRTDCHSPTASKVIKIMCDGKQYCRIKAENKAFTDPCPGQVKYAKANYLCVPKNPSLTFNGDNSLLGKLFYSFENSKP